MPRTARTWAPGFPCHIDVRAHGGAPIFATAEDRAFVIDHIARVFAEYGIVCL